MMDFIKSIPGSVWVAISQIIISIPVFLSQNYWATIVISFADCALILYFIWLQIRNNQHKKITDIETKHNKEISDRNELIEHWQKAAGHKMQKAKGKIRNLAEDNE